MGEHEDDIPLTGRVREKLVERKQDRAREGRLLTGTTGDPVRDRLPPGQTLVRDWPILDLGVQPDVARDKFRLRVEGMVENPLRLDWDAFMALPQAEQVCDIHCVTQWSRYDNRFAGVKAETLLALARPKLEARFVVFHSYDGYTTNLPLDEFGVPDTMPDAMPDAMLAHSWEGKPLTRQH